MKLGEKRGGCAADGRHCLLGVQLCTSAEGAGEGGAADGNHCLLPAKSSWTSEWPNPCTRWGGVGQNPSQPFSN